MSQRVVSAFERRQLSGYKAKPVEITKKAARKLQVSAAPEYFVLEVSGRITMPVQSWVRIDDVPAETAEKLKAAWDGSDIFVEENAAAGRWALFCSENVFQLARAERWTNCGFQPLQYFAPFHKRLYLQHETALPLEDLMERYKRKLR